MESRRKPARKSILKNPKLSLLMKNFQKLGIEEKAVILSHGLIIFFCFFPWIRITPYSAKFIDPYEIYMFSNGNVSRFILLLILFLSLLVLVFFLDKLLILKKLRIPFSRKYVHLFVSAQQFIMIFLAISAMVIWGKQIGETDLNLGFFGCLIAIISGGVSTFLEIKKEKKSHAQEFFRAPQKNQKTSPENAPKDPTTQQSLNIPSAKPSSEAMSPPPSTQKTDRKPPVNIIDKD